MSFSCTRGRLTVFSRVLPLNCGPTSTARLTASTLSSTPSPPRPPFSSDYAMISSPVLEQCDALDGVVHGLLVNSRHSHPDLEPLSCESIGANQSSCLRKAKMETVQAIWVDWTSTEGNFLSPGFEVGSKGLPGFWLLECHSVRRDLRSLPVLASS
jgi:hypothetical protein